MSFTPCLFYKMVDRPFSETEIEVGMVWLCVAILLFVFFGFFADRFLFDLDPSSSSIPRPISKPLAKTDANGEPKKGT